MEQKIYKATYSGVPVYEMTCNGVAVMRRKNDHYMNATQILKVANFDKPQRTRILEREVQIGEHEKIQGGYGKYQGTWVPLEKAINLSEHYNVDNLIRPLLDFVKGDESPPLAPKHPTAPYTTRKPRERRAQKKAKQILDDNASDADDDSVLSIKNDTSLSTQTQTSSPRRYRRRAAAPMTTDSDKMISQSDTNDDLHSKTTRHSRHKRSKLNDEQEYMDVDDETMGDDTNELGSTLKSKQRQFTKPPRAPGITKTPSDLSSPPPPPPAPPSNDRVSPTKYKSKKEVEHERTYAHQLFAHFLSENDSIPALLQRPPRDLDVNVIIDEVGHTCLHWAAVMGHIATVEQLIRLKADIYRVNYKGQTALMRSVLYTNNFERLSFDKLLDHLSGTIFNIDKSDQTVFHHVAATSSSKGKVHASHYYMENLINKLAHNRSEIISILNVQDVCGDTALTIVARIGNKRLARMLIDAGASPEIANEEGTTAQDYLTALDHQTTGNDQGEWSPTFGSLLNQNEELTRQQIRQKVETMYKSMISGNTMPTSSSSSSSTSAPSISRWVDHLAASYERDMTKMDNAIKDKQRAIQQVSTKLDETEKARNLLADDQQDEIQKVMDEGDRLALELRRILLYNQQIKLKKSIREQEVRMATERTETSSSSSSSKSQITKPPTPPLAIPTNNNHQPSPSSYTNINGEIAKHSTQTTLQGQLDQLQQTRKQLLNDIITQQTSIPEKRIQNYKRLISMCCNITYENVDSMVGYILDCFDKARASSTRGE